MPIEASPCCNALPICTRREEVTDVYDTPLLELVYKAATVHRMYNDPHMVRNQPAVVRQTVLTITIQRSRPVDTDVTAQRQSKITLWPTWFTMGLAGSTDCCYGSNCTLAGAQHTHRCSVASTCSHTLTSSPALFLCLVGAALHAVEHQDGRVPRKLQLLQPEQPLVRGYRPQGREADGAGGGVRG